MPDAFKMGKANAETIARVLYQVREEIIREGLDGQAHVDALLMLRGLDPAAQCCCPRFTGHVWMPLSKQGFF